VGYKPHAQSFVDLISTSFIAVKYFLPKNYVKTWDSSLSSLNKLGGTVNPTCSAPLLHIINQIATESLLSTFNCPNEHSTTIMLKK
jgi:hypothetical protein